ncbi:unnamed protein product [Darwinula stevensoni]|uniref:7-dehydrocholesterol reductase n=1 Tax=Darwinula stevensoni TaxID=69355 RepID=A0A7R9A5F2_9CRUS|nr:unnamed protein product [Darwinula stevensoni]CAG0886348.1 unnamed protein product [Darwinula stevensoni]
MAWSIQDGFHPKELTPGDAIRYYVFPCFLVLVCTPGSLFLLWFGQGKDRPAPDASVFLGSSFAWTVVAVTLAWAYAFLRIPSAKCHGPTTYFGQTPEYQANGVLYFWASLIAFVFCCALWPDLPVSIYEEMPYIMGSLNSFALLFCVLLLVRGKYWPQSKERIGKFPLIYEYYRGMELHPRIFGVDIKQLIICRFGMIAWELLNLTYLFAGLRLHSYNAGFLVSVLLQSIYLAKFFWWEAGYFDTLDIIYDRAGFYLCYGCLVFVPSIYAFSSYYFVAHPPLVSDVTAWVVFGLGIAFVLLNYKVDYEKQVFKNTGGKCEIWGKPARYLEVEYSTTSGVKRSKLLTSGFWGMSRHFNYVFELLAAYSWAVVGIHYGAWPFLYSTILTILLVQRIFRDEEKCSKKYGKYWDQYCKRVPYRLIPGVF